MQDAEVGLRAIQGYAEKIQPTGKFLREILISISQVAAKKAREDPDAAAATEAFDSNCITPGTPFMGRLAAHLRFFFRKKMAEDSAWQKPVIIFSGMDHASSLHPAS